jgi:hypothetical protein
MQRDGLKTRKWYWERGTRRFGVGTSTVFIRGERYLDRFILFFGYGTIRLHRFWRPDDDRASHTHPFAFLTIPLHSYTETEYWHGCKGETRIVPAFKPSLRKRSFEHRVIGISRTPCWTFVITSPYSSDWGFYPSPYEYVHNEFYNA